MSECKECFGGGFTEQSEAVGIDCDGEMEYTSIRVKCGSCPYGVSWHARQDRIEVRKELVREAIKKSPRNQNEMEVAQ